MRTRTDIKVYSVARIEMNSHREGDLELAARHVAEGRLIVAHQRERIARLKALGCSTLDHEQTLDVFLSTLKIFEDHERTLRDNDSRKNLAR